MSGIRTGGNACLYGSAPRIRTSSCWKRENTNCQIKRMLFSKISRYAGALRFHLIGIWIWCWSRWLRRWFCCILLIKWGKFLLFSVNSNNFSQYFRSVSLSHRLSFSSPHSPSVSVCVGLIAPRVTYSVHISLASPSHSSPECPPTVGYYCLIKGRLGRHWPDKSIKLPLAVPEGGGWGGGGSRWILSLVREYPRVHLFQMVSEGVYAEAARRVQQ